MTENVSPVDFSSISSAIFISTKIVFSLYIKSKIVGQYNSKIPRKCLVLFTPATFESGQTNVRCEIGTD